LSDLLIKIPTGERYMRENSLKGLLQLAAAFVMLGAWYTVKFVVLSAVAFLIGLIAVGSIRLIIPTLFIPTIQFIPDWAIFVAIGWSIMLCGRASVRAY